MTHEPESGDLAAGANGAAPSMNILAQYLKDLSFENPNAPQSLMQNENQPQIDISVNVNANTLAPTDYEVELQLGGKAMVGTEAVDQEHRRSGAVVFVVNAALAELSDRHRAVSACGGSGARAGRGGRPCP